MTRGFLTCAALAFKWVMAEMDLDSYKLLSAILLFLVALGGCLLARKAAGLSPKLVRLCNAAAGGILVAVTLVHILPESAEGLEAVGKAMSTFLGGPGAEAFPLGFALCGIGFLTIVSIEVFLPGTTKQEQGSLEEGNSEGSSENQEDHTTTIVKQRLG